MTDTTPAATSSDSIGLLLPEGWLTLPIATADFDRYLATMREEIRTQPGWSKTLERRIELLSAQMRRELIRVGAVFAAMFIGGTVDDDGNVDDDPLLAACTFGAYTRRDLDTELDLTVPVLFTAFAASGPERQRTHRPVDLEPPEIVELPVGEAVHLRRLYQPTSVTTADEPFYGEAWILPLGTDGDVAGVLQFATVNVDMSTDFSELFNAIAHTLTLMSPDEPTAFHVPIRPNGDGH